MRMKLSLGTNYQVEMRTEFQLLADLCIIVFYAAYGSLSIFLVFLSTNDILSPVISNMSPAMYFQEGIQLPGQTDVLNGNLGVITIFSQVDCKADS